MAHYIIRRIVSMLILLVIVSGISFFIITMTPGSPYPWGDMNPKISQEAKEAYNKKFHLDKPIHEQYLLTMRDLFTGELVSNKDERPVLEKIAERIPATLILNITSLVMVFVFSIPIGVISARFAGRWPDGLLTLFSFTCIALPGFWVAYLVMLYFVKVLGMPVLGLATFGVAYESGMQWWMDRIWHVMFPAAILALSGIAIQSRYLRAAMQETLQEDYIRTARAKGLADEGVLYKHALRNSIRPMVTGVGLMVPVLLGGSVIIESIIAYPGMGRLGYEAIMERDYPVLVTLNFVIAVLVLLGNFLADILYAVVDPRVRLEA